MVTDEKSCPIYIWLEKVVGGTIQRRIPTKPSDREWFQVSRTFLSEGIPKKQEWRGSEGCNHAYNTNLTLTQNHYLDQNHNLNPEL